mmetsp:Transcript_19432/g.54103  ORF Transcript_19432/g.54103 Transcript_19432/m.54103 type:complete len:231 (-) Transcript_19432:66-758(-)
MAVPTAPLRSSIMTSALQQAQQPATAPHRHICRHSSLNTAPTTTHGVSASAPRPSRGLRVTGPMRLRAQQGGAVDGEQPGKREPLPSSSLGGEEKAEFGSNAWRTREPVLALPAVLQTPSAWFLLAGVLKVLFLVTANTPVAARLSVFGLPPLLSAYFTLIPAGIGLVLLAKVCVERGWIKHPLFVPAAVLIAAAIVAVSWKMTLSAAAPPSIRATTKTITVSTATAPGQ